MKSLFNSEDKKYIAALGHELEIGNKVEWTTSGYNLIGRIVGFENDKAIVQTIGCRYSTGEELEKIKAKAKQKYNVAPGRLYLLVPKDTYKKTT